MKRGALCLVLGLGLLPFLSCKDGPTGPVAGSLNVKITMPPASSGLDGAILFTITGPAAPDTAAAATGFAAFHQPLAQTTRYVVTGTLTSGATILTITVDDTRQSYTATIQQVAASGPGYQLRGSLTGYALAVTR